MSDGFLGYVRPDGRVGTRNHLLVLSVTGLTGPSARRVAATLRGAVFAGTPYHGGMIGTDRDLHRRTLAGLAGHPNCGAVLVLGADPPVVEEVAAAARAAGTPVEAVALDDCGHDALTLVDVAIRRGAGLLKALSRQRRVAVPLSGLVLGLECGRSDPSSGLVANPVIGMVSDAVVAAGGVSILGETVEWTGAEDRLAARATDPALGGAIVAAVLRREALAVAAGVDLTGTNPGATNIAGGLSTIEEKSLGAVAKSGTASVAGLLATAERPARPGLHVMDAPAYAPESLTSFAAAGATLMLFATGVGNSFGAALAPTLKITANPDTAARLPTQIDVSLAAVFTGEETLHDGAARLLAAVRDTASGATTFAEIFGDGEDAFSRLGESL